MVAVTLGVAATMLLVYGFESSWGSSWLSGVAGDVRRAPLVGAATLVGLVLAMIAAFAAFLIARPSGPKSLSVAKTPSGSSQLNRGSLASSVQRSLRETVHPEVVVKTAGKRLDVAAPVRSVANPMEFVDELAAAMPNELSKRGATKVRYRVSSGSAAKSRVR